MGFAGLAPEGVTIRFSCKILSANLCQNTSFEVDERAEIMLLRYLWACLLRPLCDMEDSKVIPSDLKSNPFVNHAPPFKSLIPTVASLIPNSICLFNSASFSEIGSNHRESAFRGFSAPGRGFRGRHPPPTGSGDPKATQWIQLSGKGTMSDF